LTALFIFPASLLRPLGGWLSDVLGPRPVNYAVFVGLTLTTLPICLPQAVLPLNVAGFTAFLFGVAVCMGIGKASVYKQVATDFPHDVGAVGGLVGMLGALGGFVLPMAFGFLGRNAGYPQASFLALAAITVASMVWLHLTGPVQVAVSAAAPAHSPSAGGAAVDAA
jgi:NNP family nitrate/nitrite transporter-like MFS transporter